MNAKEMVDTLMMSGLDTKMDVIKGILDRKEESFPHLARLATSREYWYSDSINPWATTCAIHLLGIIGHYQAQLAANSSILEYWDDSGDWLTEDAPHALAQMGADAVPTLTAFLHYTGANMYVRNTVARALIMIINRHPETKSEIVASIMAAAQKESDIETRTCLVDTLVDLRDPDLYDYLSNSLKTGFITPDFFSLNDLDKIYTGDLSHYGIANDPMYIFEPRYKESFTHFGGTL